jgi:solute carrier family 25 citrate transporter 1
MSAPAAAADAAVTSPTNATGQKKKKNLAIHLMAGGVAGCCEALACHPLDTIKVRLQLRGERAALKNSPAKVAADALKNGAAAAKVAFNIQLMHAKTQNIIK